MKNINKEKTNELLKGLGENVEVENIDTYLQKQGVVVDISVGRLRLPISIDPKMYGVNLAENKELNEFFEEHIKDSKLVFISKQSEKRLQSLETNVRQKLSSLAIGYNNKYLPIETYKEFEKFFADKRAKYLSIRDEIVDNWEETVKVFAFKLEMSLSQLNSLDRENMKLKIMKKIPSMEEYRDSFYMETRIKAFPVMANINVFDEEISKKVREGAIKENINSVYEIISSVLNNAFVTLSKAYSYYKNHSTLNKTQIDKINSLVPMLKRNNLLKNELIDEIISDLTEVSKETDIDSKFQIIDIILAKIYKFASEIEILDKISMEKSFYDIETLDSLVEAL